jgi:uncharacterized cupredoxin-like copper-binding protein
MPRVLALAVMVGCGVSGALAADSVINVDMADFAYALSSRVIAAGPVTFRVKNLGAVQHDFEIVGQSKTEVLEVGAAEDLHAVLAPGTYEYRCTVPGHAEAGMKGVLRVR